MSSTDTQSYRPSPADRIGIICFLVLGVAIIAWSAITTIVALVDLGRGTPVVAAMHFIDTPAEITVEGGGAPLEVDIESALLTSTDPSPMTVGTAMTAAVAAFLVSTGIVVCLMLLARNTLRGRIFSRANTWLVTAAGMTALVGFGLVSVLQQMVGNTVAADLTDGFSEHFAVMTADPLPFVLLAFAFGIIATAYTVGARMQREQEGLI